MSRLFRSRKQRERDERRERRRAFRRAENAIDDVKDRIQQLDREADKQWDQAKTALKGGEKEKARRLLTGYRANQVLVTRMEQKRWVFEQYFNKMESAKTDQDFASAMASVNKVISIDPENVEDVFSASQDILDEKMDTDRFWNKLYEKESGGASSELEAHIPAMDDLEKQLQEESAIEVDSGAKDAVSQQLNERIQSNKERIQKILEDKKGK